ncbi:MAG: DUF86 domain-containing protein [Deltaproteobacteria bacterium]|jgi:uncharacterized protein YutE (UPF0331/DUF86 family)|nr:DUF86 domain-containing protein [Deltaproteobacteria bacterium]
MSDLDVVLAKINVIKTCLSLIEKAKVKEADLEFRLSIYELNLQRAIQACIDLANIVLSKEGLGLPTTYRQSFQILEKHLILTPELTRKMASMVGFRNISVHDYEQINMAIVQNIVDHYLSDFETFYKVIYARVQNWPES